VTLGVATDALAYVRRIPPPSPKTKDKSLTPRGESENENENENARLTSPIHQAIVVPVLPYRLQALNYTNISALTSYLLLAYSAGIFVCACGVSPSKHALMCSVPSTLAHSARSAQFARSARFARSPRSARLPNTCASYPLTPTPSLAIFPVAYFFHRYPYRRGPMIAAVLALELGLILFMLIQPYPVMVISRFIQGAASAVVWSGKQTPSRFPPPHSPSFPVTPARPSVSGVTSHHLPAWGRGEQKADTDGGCAVGFALICENVPEKNIGRQIGFATSGVSIGTTIVRGSRALRPFSLRVTA
jgi:MFS family permease